MKDLKGITLTLVLLVISAAYSYSQCYMDRHNTNLNSSWLSCNTRLSPNPDRGIGHWISYQLDERKTVKELKLWNMNNPESLDSGAKTIEIDYVDQDGVWQSLSSHSLAAGQASGFYEGEELELPREFVTDHILLTITENYGGSCAGLAEVRIGVSNTSTSVADISEDHFDVEISPNPFHQFTNVTVADLEEKTIRYEVVNNLGQVISSQKVDTQNGMAQFQINATELIPGNYFLKIIDGNRISSRKLSHQIQ